MGIGGLTSRRAIATVLTLVLAGCAGSPTSPGASASSAAPSAAASGAASGPVKIGLLAPITGDVAADGEEMQRGAQMAVDEINAAGGVNGVQLELVVADAVNLQPDAVTSAVQRLSADPAVAVMITGYATVTNFEIDLMEKLGMPYLVSANPASTRRIVQADPAKYWMIWSLVPTFDVYGTDVPKYLELAIAAGKWTPRDRSYYFVSSDNEYSNDIGNGMVNTLDDLGWKQVGKDVTPDQDISDWRAIIAKIRSANPDFIINTDYRVSNEATFMSQFLQTPTNSQIYLEYGPSIPEFLNLTKDQSTGVLYALSGGAVESKPRTKEIREKFRQRWGVETGVYGIFLYEEVYLYAETLAKVGDPADKRAIADAIGSVDKEIAMGRLRFDPATHLALNGENEQPFQIYQIWEGERVEVYPPSLATGELRLPPWFN